MLINLGNNCLIMAVASNKGNHNPDNYISAGV
jgi:hypothetical protein